MTTETREIRLKRLALRSSRRGIREMDLILSAFATRDMGGLTDDELDGYEALLEENDHDIFAWILGRQEVPGQHQALIGRIAATTGGFLPS